MAMISRRQFLASSSAIALVAVSDNCAKGAFDGSSSVSANSPVIINFGGASDNYYALSYTNMWKQWNPLCAQQAWPAVFAGGNGYPNGNFTSNPKGTVYPDPAYYGHYILSWSATAGSGGVGAIGIAPTLIFSRDGTSTIFGESPANGGETSGNMAVKTGATGANIEFAYGILIRGFGTDSSTGTTLVKFSSANAGRVGGLSEGMKMKFFNLTGLPDNPNSADGSWTIHIIDGNNFSLLGSTAYIGSVGGIVTRGGPSLRTHGIYSVGSDSPTMFGDFTGSNFSKLVWCKKSDLNDLQTGKLATQNRVDSFKNLNAAYIRFMDICQVQAIQQPDYAHRVTPSNFSWGNSVNPIAYWGGVMTKRGDTFICPINPTASPASGDYVNGEVVIAQIGTNGHNTTPNPRMGITGRKGDAPIYYNVCCLINLVLTGTVPPSGTTLSMVFTGGGLATPFTYNYKTSTTVAGPGTVSDTSITNIIFNIRADIQNNVRGNAGPLLAAGMYCENPSRPALSLDGGIGSPAQACFYYNQNINSSGAAQLGAGMTITGSDPTSNLTFTLGLIDVNYYQDNLICSFTYSKLLQGWVGTRGDLNGSATQGGVVGGPPLEYIAELCARSNAGAWYNVGVMATSTTIYNTVLNLAQAIYNGRPAIKSLALEFGNETWNGQLSLAGPLKTQAAALGISITTGGSAYSAHGLRTLQMAQQATAAWSAAGRARSDLKIVNAYQFVNLNSAGTSETSVFRFNGSVLNASGSGTNVTLKAFGALGVGTLSTNFSIAPNRPIDWCDWISPATYWEGGQYNATGGALTMSPLSGYNGALLAAYNFAYGNSTQEQAALDFLYNVSANTGDLYTGTFRGTPRSPFVIAPWKVGSGDSSAGYFGVGTVAASYDTSRSTNGTGGGAQLKVGVACYEGGWEMGPVSGGQLAGSLSGLGYTNGYSSALPGAAAGPSGASDTATTASQNLYNLMIAFKNDARCMALVNQQFNEFKIAVNVISARDAYPSWYGFQGTTIWALWPNLSTQSAPFKAYDAIAALR
jgi:hypothetical protein